MRVFPSNTSNGDPSRRRSRESCSGTQRLWGAFAPKWRANMMCLVKCHRIHVWYEFTYIYHTSYHRSMVNVTKYTIHGSFGNVDPFDFLVKRFPVAEIRIASQNVTDSSGILGRFGISKNTLDLGVSKNSGTPKWMVYNGKPY